MASRGTEKQRILKRMLADEIESESSKYFVP